MSGSFTFVSSIALLCYVFLLITFTHADGNRVLRSFRVVLYMLTLWAAGSLFMRIRLWPGIKVWYDASLLGLCLVPCAIINFLHKYADEKPDIQDFAIYIAVLIINLINILTSDLLPPPEAVALTDGEVSFVYTFNTRGVLILYGCAFLAFANILLTVRQRIKQDPSAKNAYLPIVLGCCAILAGNILIMLPVFSGIPLDILGGIINSVCMVFMLYRKRMFKLTQLTSRRSCYLLSAVATGLAFVYIINPVQSLLVRALGVSQKTSILIVSVLYTLCTIGVMAGMKVTIDNVFGREEQNRAQLVEDFSRNVSRMLSVNDILGELISVIIRGAAVSWVSVLTPDGTGEKFVMTRGSNPLERRDIYLTAGNPVLKHLEKTDACLMEHEIGSIDGYRSLWENEKQLLAGLNAGCFVPLTDKGTLIGVLILSPKEKGKRFNFADETFLTSVKTVAAIAVKNANLYEKADHDARTDDLTGLTNRKYFMEELNRQFDACRDTSLALIHVNIDDFKLFNQLYGNTAGDAALRLIAVTLLRVVGENGSVARYSGKEFMVLLPEANSVFAQNLATHILEQIAAISNITDDLDSCKTMTASIGICVYPFAASTPKQLLGNAEQAVYQVKRAGKNGVRMYAAAKDAISGKADEPADYQKVYSTYAPTIYALTAAIDAKDHYTFNHSNNVAYYATRLAHAYGLGTDSIEIINEAALLHDVGKIGVPEHILNKQTRLTDQEFAEMTKHVENSVNIIRHLPSLDYVIPAVIGHHECYDGSGYPRRIAGQDIPLYARILCVADSFDAMTSRRVYKEPYPVEKALGILKEASGKQFDPELAELFIKEFTEGRIELQFK